MKSELQQLITELENEIINYDQNRSRAQHISTLKKIASNMQKELDRMPEFDISIPDRKEDAFQVVKNIIILPSRSDDNEIYLPSILPIGECVDAFGIESEEE